METSDTNVTPPASITDMLWVGTSVSAAGTHPSLPALPQPSVTVKSPLKNLHLFLKRIWTYAGTHHSFATQLTTHPSNRNLPNAHVGAGSILGIGNTTANLAHGDYILLLMTHSHSKSNPDICSAQFTRSSPVTLRSGGSQASGPKAGSRLHYSAH